MEEAIRVLKGWAVRRLHADFTARRHANTVDGGNMHQILWLAPGTDPVRIINIGPVNSDTSRVIDGNL